MKQEYIMHLEPSKVLAFIDMGVVFGDTTHLYSKRLPGYGEGYALIINNGRLAKYSDWMLKDGSRACMPAPNLQELLAILPEQLKLVPNGADFKLVLWVRGGRWVCNYETATSQMGRTVEYYDTALDAVCSRLEWVVSNYPQELKGGSNVL